MNKTTQSYPSFSQDVYDRRHQTMRSMMARDGLDALIVYGLTTGLNDNVEYLAGRTHTNGLLLFPAVGNPVLFVQPPALVQFIAKTAVVEVRSGGFDYAAETIAAIADHRLDTGTIGIVEVDTLRTRGLPHELFLALQSRFPQARFRTVTEAYELVRARRDPEELVWVDRAADEMDEVLDVFVDALRLGAALPQVEATVHAFARERGIQLRDIRCRAAAMDGSTLLRDPASPFRVISQGDMVFFESSIRYGSYGAHGAFPIAFGDPPADCRNLFDTALEVAKEIAARLRPGCTAEDLIAAGDIVPQRGLWADGPLAILQPPTGWQMISLRGLTAYRPATNIRYEEGMTLSICPHLCLPDSSKITILANGGVVTADGSRLTGSHGLRYVIK